MKIAVFFTFDYSLNTWFNSGTLHRELKIYQNLSNKFGIKFLLITYGNNTEIKLLEQFPEFEIIPIYSHLKYNSNKILRFIKSFFIPFFLKNKLNSVDIFHQHQLLGVWVPLILKFLIKKPVLVRTGYDMSLFAKLENKPLHIRIFYEFLTFVTIKSCDLLTVASKSDFSSFINKMNSSKLRIRSNWVEANNNFIDINNRIDNKILLVGRVENQKFFEYIIDSFSNSRGKLIFDLVGEGSSMHGLAELAENKNVDLNFFGKLNHERLQNLYSEYKFFMSSSIFEGNPKTILEAMANGCVVFASNIENHKEIINNMENGCIFDLDKKELKNLFDKISKNKELTTAISRNAIKSILEKYSIDVLVDEMQKDYKFIVN